MSGVTVRGGLRKAVQRAMYDGELILIQDLHRFLGSPDADAPLPQEIADRVSELLVTPQRDRRLSFSPSQLHTCERRQVFQYAGVEKMETLQSELMNLFRDGTWRHLRLQATLLHAGLINEVETSIGKPDRRLTGSIDGIGEDDNGAWLLEIKGINPFQFEKLLDIEAQPLESHLYQGAGYALATGVMRVVFLYECKSTQRFKEFDVDYSMPEYAPYLDEVRDILDRLNDHIDAQTLPEPLAPDAKECFSCPFVLVCGEMEPETVYGLVSDEEERRGVNKDTKKRVVKKVKKPAPVEVAEEESEEDDEYQHVRSDLKESELPWRLRKHR